MRGACSPPALDEPRLQIDPALDEDVRFFTRKPPLLAAIVIAGTGAGIGALGIALVIGLGKAITKLF